MPVEDLINTSELTDVCAAVCTQQVQIDLTVFGIVVALAIGVLWYIHRRLDLQSRPIMRGYLLMQGILLVIFLFTIVGYQRGPSCGSGCDENSVSLHMTIFPKSVTDVVKGFIGIPN